MVSRPPAGGRIESQRIQLIVRLRVSTSREKTVGKAIMNSVSIHGERSTLQAKGFGRTHYLQACGRKFVFEYFLHFRCCRVLIFSVLQN